MHILKDGEEIAEKIKDLKEVKAIAFYGSIGMGFNDKLSDIDLVAYVDKIPSKKDIMKKLEGIEKIQIIPNDMIVFYYKDMDCIINFETIKHLEKKIGNLKEGKGLDHRIAMYIQNVRPIYGEELIKDLKKEVRKYPKEILKKELVPVRGVTTFFEGIDKTLKRNKILWIDLQFHQCLERIIKAVYALNKRYYPGNAKWAIREIKNFKKVPKNFTKDIDKFVKLNSIKDFNRKLGLLEKVLLNLGEMLNKEERKLVKLKPKKWYDKKRSTVSFI